MSGTKGAVMDDERLKEIEARAAAATPGPWEVNNAHGMCVIGDGGEEFVADMEGAMWQGKHEDASFIAAARTDIPDLVARVRELEAEVAGLRTRIERLEDVADKANDAIGGLLIGASADVFMAPVRAAMDRLHENSDE